MDENILLVIKEKPVEKKVRFSPENEIKIIENKVKRQVLPIKQRSQHIRKPKRKMGMVFF